MVESRTSASAVAEPTKAWVPVTSRLATDTTRICGMMLEMVSSATLDPVISVSAARSLNTPGPGAWTIVKSCPSWFFSAR